MKSFKYVVLTLSVLVVGNASAMRSNKLPKGYVKSVRALFDLQLTHKKATLKHIRDHLDHVKLSETTLKGIDERLKGKLAENIKALTALETAFKKSEAKIVEAEGKVTALGTQIASADTKATFTAIVKEAKNLKAALNTLKEEIAEETAAALLAEETLKGDLTAAVTEVTAEGTKLKAEQDQEKREETEDKAEDKRDETAVNKGVAETPAAEAAAPAA